MYRPNSAYFTKTVAETSSINIYNVATLLLYEDSRALNGIFQFNTIIETLLNFHQL